MKLEAIGVLDRIGVLRAARALQRPGCVILTYHGVLADAGGHDFLNHNFVPAEMFERHLQYICRYYRPMPLRDVVSYYERGDVPPPRSLALTFDDGFANNYTVAFPLLKRYGVPFTIFLTTGLIDRPGAQLWTERLKRAIYLCSADVVTLSLMGAEVRHPLSSTSQRAETTRQISLLLKRLSVPDRDAALDHYLLKIPQAEIVGQIPAHAQQDD